MPDRVTFSKGRRKTLSICQLMIFYDSGARFSETAEPIILLEGLDFLRHRHGTHGSFRQKVFRAVGSEDETGYVI